MSVLAVLEWLLLKTKMPALELLKALKIQYMHQNTVPALLIVMVVLSINMAAQKKMHLGHSSVVFIVVIFCQI